MREGTACRQGRQSRQGRHVGQTRQAKAQVEARQYKVEIRVQSMRKRAYLENSIEMLLTSTTWCAAFAWRYSGRIARRS
jgi:acetolactate synthase regulatory subunit